MRMRRFTNLIMLLFAALVLTSTGQAWAAVTGTVAGTPVSNTATVEFTVAGSSSSKTDSVTFLVDRKINVLVANKDTFKQVLVVPGAANMSLSFDVTNLSNTAATGTDYFKLEIIDSTTDATFDMSSSVAIYEDFNNDGAADGAALAVGVVVVIPNDTTSGNNTKRYLIKGDVPAGAAAGQLDGFNLVATAWSSAIATDPKLLEDADASNNIGESEIVFADAATDGDYAADITEDGRHSDLGTFSVSDPVTITKTVGDGASNYHIPGDTITYTITVQNSDLLLPVTGIIISDPIPSPLVYAPSSLSCVSDGTAGTPQWSVNGSDWSSALVDDATTAKYVRCHDATLPVAGVGLPSKATLTFKASIP